MTYDAKCYELAQSFLAEVKHQEKDVVALAQDIQQAIEDYMLGMEPIARGTR